MGDRMNDKASDLTRLYEVANDHETDMLDDLRERAGMVWVCSCLWRNDEADEECGDCDEKRPERDASGRFPRKEG